MGDIVARMIRTLRIKSRKVNGSTVRCLKRLIALDEMRRGTAPDDAFKNSRLFAAVDSFAQGEEQADDIACVAIRRGDLFTSANSEPPAPLGETGT